MYTVHFSILSDFIGVVNGKLLALYLLFLKWLNRHFNILGLCLGG